MPQPPYAIISTSRHRRPRFGLLILSTLVLAGAGIGAALLLRPPGALPEIQAAHAPSPAPTIAPSVPLMARSASVCITCGTVEAVAGSGEPAGGKPYKVQVRMDDGSLRSFTSASQPAPGAAVRVEGSGFRLVGTGG